MKKTFVGNYSKPFIGYICDSEQLHRIAICPSLADPNSYDISKIPSFQIWSRRLLMNAVCLLYFIRYCQRLVGATDPNTVETLEDELVGCFSSKTINRKNPLFESVFQMLFLPAYLLTVLALVRIIISGATDTDYSMTDTDLVLLWGLLACWSFSLVFLCIKIIVKKYDRSRKLCHKKIGFHCSKRRVCRDNWFYGFGGRVMNNGFEPLLLLMSGRSATAISLTMDRTLNIICYMANIWIIYIEDDPLDMLLNSIAMEFITDLDNEIIPIFYNSVFERKDLQKLLRYRLGVVDKDDKENKVCRLLKSCCLALLFHFSTVLAVYVLPICNILLPTFYIVMAVIMPICKI